jgi:hypothetical protein
MRMMKCPTSGLILPNEFVDEKQSLKRLIDSWLDKAVEQFQHIKNTYFLTFHAKFDEVDPTIFKVDSPKITSKIPPFISNSLVFWVNNQKGICELLWMVPAKKTGKKLKVEFNTNGVAYLQAKGAMPS